jgi:hypothetical protein
MEKRRGHREIRAVLCMGSYRTCASVDAAECSRYNLLLVLAARFGGSLVGTEQTRFSLKHPFHDEAEGTK